MTPADIADARQEIGRRWAGRPFSREEFARILRLAGEDKNRAMSDLERGKSRISGPLTLSIDLMLAGGPPPGWRDLIDRGHPIPDLPPSLEPAVAAAIRDLERQEFEAPDSILCLYGKKHDPASFGIDGEVDLVALVHAIARAAP